MKTCGWTGGVLVAIITTSLIWISSASSQRVLAEKPAVAVHHTATAEDLNSEAAMRYRFSQPRHWRHLVMSR